MKTLKKTLCLVLAMVMVFGLCAVSASAKLDNYTDKDKITYAEAVDVMSGIGILQGDERGFRPTDDITRAEAAKILAYILVGNSGQADALKASAAPFSDVPASHWASGYISYCATAGIVGGMGDGTFKPSDKVTGLQFAKMLLCALGYGVNDEYAGTDWAINTSRDALRLGIFEDNLAGANNNAATREECALYAFNAITGIKKVSYSALLGGYITNTGLGSNTSTGTDSPDANKKAKFADDFKLVESDPKTDAFKRDDGHYWYINDSKRTVITADYDADKRLKNIYTTKVTGDDIYQLLGDDASKSTPTDKATALEVYVNGEKKTDASYSTAKFVKGDTTQIKGTGNGVQTYVYSWYDDGVMKIKICIIDSYIAKVTDVKAATAKKDPVTTIKYFTNVGDDSSTVVIPSTVTTYNTDEFAKGDYVFVTVAGGEIRSMTAVNVLEDTISRYNYNKSKDEASIVSGGETYVAAKNAAKYDDDSIKAADDTTEVDRKIVNGKTHAIYVDEYGYLYAVGEVDPDSTYVYAARFGTLTDGSGEFLDSSIGVKLYYADGTSKNVPLKANATDTGALSITEATQVSTLNNEKTGLYKLKMDGDKAILLDVKEETFTAKNVKKGISSSVANDVIATNKTVFFYVKCNTPGSSGTPLAYTHDDFAITAYVGINNVPANTESTGAVPIALINDGTDVAAVLVNDNVTTSNDTVYFYTGSYDYKQDGDNWIVYYYMYVNGDPVTLEVSYDKQPSDSAAFTELANKFVTLSGKTLSNTAKVSDGTEYNKYKYWSTLVELNTNATSGNANENTITLSGSEAAAIANAKVVDLPAIAKDEVGITDSGAMIAAVTRGDTVKVAIQYFGENVVVYIVEYEEAAS